MCLPDTKAVKSENVCTTQTQTCLHTEDADRRVTLIEKSFSFFRTCPRAQAVVDTDVYLVLVWTLLLLLARPMPDNMMMLGWEARRTAGAA